MQTTISKSSARLQAIELITQLIFDGELKPEARINESQLARQFSVSQTPIREALLALHGEGLLQSEPDRGFFVKPLDLAELEGIYPVLAKLETMAFGSILGFSPKRIQRMRAINTKLTRARGRKAVLLDEQWHQELLADCPNPYLLKCIARARKDMQRYETLFFLERGTPENSAQEHDAIVDAVAAGELDKAGNMLALNCLNTIDEMRDWLENRP